MKIAYALFFSILCLCEPRTLLTSYTRLTVSSQGSVGNCEIGNSLLSARYDARFTNQRGLHYAKRGDVASGRILREENDELDLDISPCKMDRVLRFRKPYKKSFIGRVTCGGTAYPRWQVEQQ